ncbi:unnamed protein product [Citrullus colocynthis]|uniref:Uncharacterized protein n=1 Tax=Citrullus colocynthis TaxID=252529 RepID=A0ABP0YAR7_9ROSI
MLSFRSLECKRCFEYTGFTVFAWYNFGLWFYAFQNCCEIKPKIQSEERIGEEEKIKAVPIVKSQFHGITDREGEREVGQKQPPNFCT